MHSIHDRDDGSRACPPHASPIATHATSTENSSARELAADDRKRAIRAVTGAVTCCAIDASHARYRRSHLFARGMKPDGSDAWCTRDHAQHGERVVITALIRAQIATLRS